MILHLDILYPTPAERETVLRDHLQGVREGGGVFALGRVERPARVVAFDLDSTLVACEFVDELAAMRGKAHLTRGLTEKAMAGRMDFRTSYLARLDVLKGIPVADVERLIERTPLSPGAGETVGALKRAGVKTAIITGASVRLGRAIRARLGVDALYATELEERHGRLTGRVAGRLLDEDAKAAALRDFCAKNNTAPKAAVAVGDGANDLRMLAAAGLGVLYNADTPLDRILEWCL
jgi:phosphoserine phosphatase